MQNIDKGASLQRVQEEKLFLFAANLISTFTVIILILLTISDAYNLTIS
jgi:hypothetical protein